MRTKLLTLLILFASVLQAQNDLFILGGELSNSAATSVEDIDEVMPRMKALGLNTVLVPAYWELLEPEEGRFDFTLIDRTVLRARENRLQVVFLWFGAWKNSMSCYAPLWFKQDTRRFPRARTAEGKPLEIASAFSEEVFQADNRAFGELMKHISMTAADVVSMVQVENEIGMLEAARDHSQAAEKAYDSEIPKSLYKAVGIDHSTTWRALYGNDPYGEEKFMAYHYARYVGRLCQTARKYSRIPLYVNAAMNSRERQPGQYPAAGPLAHLIDFWHAGAPQLLCLAPDIYDSGFKGWADRYALPNNPLFIPETRCCENSGARAMYAFGEHHALGFSPFAIDQASDRQTQSITAAYSLLRQLRSREMKGSKFKVQRQWGLLFDQQDQERTIRVEEDGTVITCRHYFTLPWDPRASDGTTWPEGGAILMKWGKNEYLLAGTGVVVNFATEYEKAREEQTVLGEDGFNVAGSGKRKEKVNGHTFNGPRIGIAAVDEVTIDETGEMRLLRRLNGDQTHQGRHVRIACGDWKILHIRLYRYE